MSQKLKKIYQIITEFQLSFYCHNKLSWGFHQAFDDGITYYCLHLGCLKICLDGYKRY